MAIDLSALEADAKAVASAALTDAKVAIVQLLSALAGTAEGAVPTLTTDVTNVLLDFIPSAFRGLAQSLIANATAPLDAAAVAAIKLGLSVALARINALL
jgi:hypothetical protein